MLVWVMSEIVSVQQKHLHSLNITRCIISSKYIQIKMSFPFCRYHVYSILCVNITVIFGPLHLSPMVNLLVKTDLHICLLQNKLKLIYCLVLFSGAWRN